MFDRLICLFLSRYVLALASGFLLQLATHPVSASIDPSSVLVLYNNSSEEGMQIAGYYQSVYPEVRLLGLTQIPSDEQVSSEVYFNHIRPQVLEALDDDTQVIVTTRGLPLIINNGQSTKSGWKQFSSLESELTRIDTIQSKDMMGNQAWYMPDYFGGNSLATNPYYKAGKTFDASVYQMRLSARLDGFSVEDIIASIDRAQKAFIGKGNQIFIDDDPDAAGASADRMDNLAHTVLPNFNMPFEYDSTDSFIQTPRQAGDVLGYISHGVHGGAPPDYLSDPVRGIQFNPAAGAIFHSWESFNACTFDSSRSSYGQGTIAQWIARGGTAGVGHVAEPGVSISSVANEDVLIPAMLSGYQFVEAAWQSIAQLSFVNTVVGDPLMQYQLWTPGDIDMDGKVTSEDLSMLIERKGLYQQTPWSDGDFNGDGNVDYDDMAIFGEYYDPEFPDATVDGDVNGDGMVNLLDLEMLGIFFGMTHDACRWQGDLNNDGRVDLLDLQIVGENYPYKQAVSLRIIPGDANGDGKVDLFDLTVLNENYGSSTNTGYADGDFNVDGVVNLVDLQILGEHYGQYAAVPEPGALSLLAVAGLIALSSRKCSRS